MEGAFWEEQQPPHLEEELGWDQQVLEVASPEESKPVLSDETRIRGVTWGDFKDEAMEPDFDPSFFFVSALTQSLAHTTMHS